MSRDCGLFRRQLQQQQAELEVHQRDGLSSYDLSQVTFCNTPSQWGCPHPAGYLPVPLFAP